MSKIKNIFLTALAIGLLSPGAFAAFPITHNLGGSLDTGKSVRVYYPDDSGLNPSIYVAGETDVDNDGLFIARYDVDGTSVAVSTFNDATYSYYLDMDNLAADNNSAAGKILIYNNYIYLPAYRDDGGSKDAVIFKYDLDTLVLVSSAVYDNGSDEYAFAMTADSQGIYVAAYGDEGGGNDSALILKYNEDLNLVDTSTFTLLSNPGNYNNSVFKDIHAYNGYLWLGGFVETLAFDIYPIVARVSNTDLETIFTYTYTGETVPDIFMSNASVVNNRRGKIIFSSEFDGNSTNDALVAVFDESLNLKSVKKIINDGANLTIKSMQDYPSGNFSFGLFDDGDENAVIYRYSSNMVLLSSETVSGGDNTMISEAVFYDKTAKKTYITGIADSGDVKTLVRDMAVNENLLNLVIKRGYDNAVMENVPVAVVGLDTTTMMPDTNIAFIADTDSNGNIYTYMPREREYFIAISTPNWGPTVRDQMMDPYGNFNVRLLNDEYREYRMWDIPEGMNTLSVHISSIAAGELLMADVFFASGNREMVSSGIIISTDTEITMNVYNVPDSWGAMYGVKVFKPGDQVEYTSYLSNFPTVSSLSVDMSSALPPSMNFDVTTSTNPPSYEGFVQDNSFAPIEGVKVTVRKEVFVEDSFNAGNYFWQRQTEENETYTDPAGRFAFYDLPAAGNYDNASLSAYGMTHICDWPNLNIASAALAGLTRYGAEVKKLGYSSNGDCFMVNTDYPAFRSYELQVATYTLEGQIQFNGIPVPFARVDAWGDWNQRAGGDSYASMNWDAGMKADAHVQTDASGNFTITGLTDGNVSLNASFWSTRKNFNDGSDGAQGGSDDLRITISSGGATLGGTLGGSCAAGDVWVVDAEAGTCISTGTVVFNVETDEAGLNGSIQGSFVFVTTYTVSSSNPLIISTSAPVMLMAIEECHGEDCGNQQMVFTSTAGIFTEHPATVGYTMSVSTGIDYWTKIMSNSWAKFRSFDDMANVKYTTAPLTMNFVLTRAGSISGVVKLPNGNMYKPNYGPEDSPNSHWLDIEFAGLDVDFHEGMGVKDDGTFEYPNLPPGRYNIELRPRGLGFNWPANTLENVVVNVGQTTNVKVQLEDGLVVQPQTQIGGFPDTWGYSVVPVPSGTKMTRKKLNELFFDDKDDFGLEYDTATATWNKIYMSQGQYDFYLVFGTGYCSDDKCDEEEDGKSFIQFANFIGSAKNVSIKEDSSNPNLGTAAQPIPINIMGSIGQNHAGGYVKGANIFTQSDYQRIFVNFDSEIMPLIPTVILYDAAGNMKGFSNALPIEAGFPSFWEGIMTKSSDTIESSFASNPLEYYIAGLAPGQYTAVFSNPNYPAVSKEINLPLEEVYNLDFDEEDILTGTISGVVKSSSTGNVLGNAKVFLTHRTIEKFMATNSSGAFSFANLPTGSYKVEVRRDGFSPSGFKASLSGSDTASYTVYLTTSSSIVQGKVYMRKYPTPVTKNGIKVVAYDETQNVAFPNKYLVKYEAKTRDDGTYTFYGVVPNHTYKIAAIQAGKLPETLLVGVSTGTTEVNDIVLKDIPPQIVVKVKKDGDNESKLNIVIESPQDLVSAPVCQYNSGTEYSSSTAVSLALIPGSNNTYYGYFVTSLSQNEYVIKVTAGNGSNQISKVITYNKANNAKTEQYIQQASIEGGQVNMDESSEEYTGLEIDTGGITYSTGTTDFSNLVGGFFSALPSVKTVKTKKGDMSLESAITGLMASEVYNIDMSNAEPNKAFALNLKYDKEKALNTNALRVYQYIDGNWREVPGNYTIDPMLGTVSVDVASIDYAYEGAGDVTTPLARKRFKMSAVSPNGTYVPRQLGSSQSGQFAVFTAKPGTGVAYTGSSFKVYNMPNPFNLKTKNVTISADGGAAITAGAYATNGTIIKYHLPAGKTGVVKFVIYNTAGEKVRNIDEGVRTGGEIFYSEWDGKNDKGTKCASGVYFMLTYLDGEQLGNKAHKMALIK